jgi:hypothetical protein
VKEKTLAVLGVDAHLTIVALVDVDVNLGLQIPAGLVGNKIPQQVKIIVRLFQCFCICKILSEPLGNEDTEVPDPDLLGSPVYLYGFCSLLALSGAQTSIVVCVVDPSCPF